MTLQELPGFLKMLDQYGIKARMLTPELPANDLLARMPGWRRLYADDVAVVYAKNSR